MDSGRSAITIVRAFPVSAWKLESGRNETSRGFIHASSSRTMTQSSTKLGSAICFKDVLRWWRQGNRSHKHKVWRSESRRDYDEPHGSLCTGVSYIWITNNSSSTVASTIWFPRNADLSGGDKRNLTTPHPYRHPQRTQTEYKL